MEDQEMIQLFWKRDSKAMEVLEERYGTYCSMFARHLLGNAEDAEECVNDAYMKVWDSIPPQKPNHMRAYLGAIIRNLALDRFRYRNAAKRGSGEIHSVLDELADCVSGQESIEIEMQRKELIDAMNLFLKELPKEQRNIFLWRYWYAMPVIEIADKMGRSNGSISVTLNRLRKKLKEFLIERGFAI